MKSLLTAFDYIKFSIVALLLSSISCTKETQVQTLAINPSENFLLRSNCQGLAITKADGGGYGTILKLYKIDFRPWL